MENIEHTKTCNQIECNSGYSPRTAKINNCGLKYVSIYCIEYYSAWKRMLIRYLPYKSEDKAD